MAKKKKSINYASLSVETITHDDASRVNIPTAEYQSIMKRKDQDPIQIAYERRNKDLDPQLVWRGKDIKDWSDLIVQAPPIYIQEKIHAKALIDDLKRESQEKNRDDGVQLSFNDFFNGLPSESAKTEFYQHEGNWANRMILGDSLQVMASLAEREGLRGNVQCIFIDPPYGIKFNSNFQWSTTSRDVKDGNVSHITREPEQVKAFRDTWRDGIHSYLTYLRDRLTVARDLLADSGSIFVQIGDENSHRVRELLDEIYGERNFISQIQFKKTGYASSKYLSNVFDTLLWYGKTDQIKFREIYKFRSLDECDPQFFDTIELADYSRRQLTKGEKKDLNTIPRDSRLLARNPLVSPGISKTSSGPIEFFGKTFNCPVNTHWKTTPERINILKKANRIIQKGNVLRMVRYLEDNQIIPYSNLWTDTGVGGFVGDERLYVVQTDMRVIARCILMTTDPGDLVLDPTCGSGSTAFMAEHWGRRWITVDTSRVALTLARARIMGAKFPYYLLTDSREGQLKEAELTRTAASEKPTHENIRHGFVYERVPHITLKSIANNAEIDVVWEKHQGILDPIRGELNKCLKKSWEEWEIPREVDKNWSEKVVKLHNLWWENSMARQKEIDASIASKADFEYLYDKPYEDKKKVRVSGPFTCESLSPHRTLTVDENDEIVDSQKKSKTYSLNEVDFVSMILGNLETSGVQQAHKEDKINFTSLMPWPGDLICAEGKYIENVESSKEEKRAGIFIGPEFGTVSRPDLVSAAREAGDADFDVLITCAFNYDAHSSEFDKLGRIPVLKARMNADLHMADDLKNTGKGNLFVIFGEPDIDIIKADDNQIQVKINGVDVFHPNTGEVRSDNADGIACWFVDTDYNEESFFIRHAYFLGANDPYKSLKTTLKAEINAEAWSSLNSDISRPFDRPFSGRIAVKVINHLGDEVMKVFKVN
jgi:adenine-specific DNA-methyltransferase